jgi:hypothetical protein
MSFRDGLSWALLCIEERRRLGNAGVLEIRYFGTEQGVFFRNDEVPPPPPDLIPRSDWDVMVSVDIDRIAFKVVGTLAEFKSQGGGEEKQASGR